MRGAQSAGFPPRPLAEATYASYIAIDAEYLERLSLVSGTRSAVNVLINSTDQFLLSCVADRQLRAIPLLRDSVALSVMDYHYMPWFNVERWR